MKLLNEYNTMRKKQQLTNQQICRLFPKMRAVISAIQGTKENHKDDSSSESEDEESKEQDE